MSFSSGFKDGFGYYMALVDEDRKRKEAELYERDLVRREQVSASQLETEEMRREELQLSIDAQKESKELRGMTLGQLEATPESELTVGKFNLMNELKTNALKLKSADFVQQKDKAILDDTLNKIEDQKERDALMVFINTSRLLQEGVIDEVQAASMLEEPMIHLRNVGALDFSKFAEKDYMNGWQRISPLIEQGDFVGVAQNHSDVLTTIFKERLSSFTGKQFEAADGRKGIIESVSFNGNFNALESDPRNMIVGANFNVKFAGDEEATTVESFLPDNVTGLIKESQTADDAKVVSVADVVDRVSAEKEVAMSLVNNPSMLKTYIEMGKGALNFKGDDRFVKDQTETYFDLKYEKEKYIGEIFTKAESVRTGLQGESNYVKALYEADPEIGQQFINLPSEDNANYAFKNPGDEALYKNALVKKHANPALLQAEVANAYAEFGNLADRADGKKPFYITDGEVFRFDSSKEDFDYRMGKKVANYAQIKNEAILAWEAARYEGSLEDADSEVYLAFMTAFINERGL
jgi:hypothetical protein